MDILTLPWLPAASPTFSDDVRRLRKSSDMKFSDLRRLSTASLNQSQLHVLARACSALPRGQAVPRIRMRLLSNANTSLQTAAFIATAPRHGFMVDVTEAPYGSWMQEALDASSATHLDAPEVVLLALDWHAFNFGPRLGQADLATSQVQAALGQLMAAADGLQRERDCVLVLQTLAEPSGALFGSLDAQVPGTLRWQLDLFNRLLLERRQPGRLLLDVAQLAAQVGADRWHDQAMWNIGKFSCSAEALPLYADHVCRLLMALRGLSKKCLVLDLDNTLWSGVIGDDGVGGIAIGQGSAEGEAHLAVQAAALMLRERGIVLAVSSKNEDAIARQPFTQHPEMLLREEHFAAFHANWQDKASNLRAIAKTLNLGVDSLVLLDDNPSERHQVRHALPEVGVPELPDTPEDYAALLLSAGYFEAVQFTDEDRQRAEQYQANALRDAQPGTATDLQAHLASLGMVAEVMPFDHIGRARITQLINKTNQFNLTTRRRTETEVGALERDEAAFTLQVRLKDRFGDNGMISVVICLRQDVDWHIDTWLMSCRVLNRCVEHLVLNVVCEQARRWGAKRLVGTYLPTPKNELVRDHFAKLGFMRVEANVGAGAARWVLELEGYTPHATTIRVEQTDAALADAAGSVFTGA